MHYHYYYYKGAINIALYKMQIKLPLHRRKLPLHKLPVTKDLYRTFLIRCAITHAKIMLTLGCYSKGHKFNRTRPITSRGVEKGLMLFLFATTQQRRNDDSTSTNFKSKINSSILF